MNQCLNPRCGRMFEPTRGHPNQKFCCVECSQHYYYLQRCETKGNCRDSYDRPLTRTTVYLVHKWFSEGMTLTEIAKITGSSMGRILKAYKVPLTEKEKEWLEIYRKG